MASPAEVMMDHLPDPSGFTLSVRAIKVIHEAAENGGVGHLAADCPWLHFGASQELPEFFDQEKFHFLDHLRPLVIEDVLLSEGLDQTVFGISMRRIHDG
jgi:hypothetical protein